MILIVDMNSEELAKSQFTKPIESIAKAFGDVKTISYNQVSEELLKAASHIILTGTPLKDNIFRDELQYFEWIKNSDVSMLGICAGMQAIGLVFGSDIVENQEIGMTKIKTLKLNPIFSGEFEVYSLHNYCIEPSNEFIILANSRKCVQAIKHRSKDIYGVIFHPEVRNANIIVKFLSILSDSKE